MGGAGKVQRLEKPAIVGGKLFDECFSRLPETIPFGTAELGRPASLVQEENTPGRVPGRDRLDGQDGRDECPHRAFLACLARHVPRSVTLADSFSILLGMKVLVDYGLGIKFTR